MKKPARPAAAPREDLAGRRAQAQPDQRPATVAQRQLLAAIEASPRQTAQRQAQAARTGPPAQLKSAASGAAGVVQRTVQSRQLPLTKKAGGGFKQVFYSTYDPKEEFDDHLEAWQHDTKLALEARKRGEGFQSDDRVPTNATYYNTPSRNVITDNKQMPHSLSHSSMAHRLGKRMRDTDPAQIAREQVLSKQEFKRQAAQEKPARMKKGEVLRMHKDYELLHDRLQELLQNGGSPEQIHELIARLMQINPYSAYGKGKSASKARIKFKNEKKEDKFSDAFDDKARFNNMGKDGYEDFRKRRKKLYSDAEDSEEEEKTARHKRPKVAAAAAAAASESEEEEQDENMPESSEEEEERAPEVSEEEEEEEEKKEEKKPALKRNQTKK